MSDYANGRPPGQNNIDATSDPYVKPENDPSATAPKTDSERPKEDGIEVRDGETKPEVQAELDEASRTMAEPATAEQPEPVKEEPKSTSRSR